jgi:choline kinase
MLDSRAPPGEKYNYQEQEAQAEQKTEKEAKRLMAETKLWRLANSAQWTAWGIVQAVIPGLPDFDKESEDEGNKDDQTETQKGEDIDAETGVGTADHDQEHPAESHEEEFDYLAYAQERAMFVWGDAVQLGIVKLEELPEGLRGKLKIVEH